MQPGKEPSRDSHSPERPPNRISLEPLRADALAALDPSGIEGLLQISLNQLQVQYAEIPTRNRALTVPDIYPNPAGHPNVQPVIPASGKLIRATFTAQLAGSPAPCRVELAIPATVLVSPAAATQTVWEWIATRGYLST